MKSNFYFRYKYLVQSNFQAKYTGYLLLSAFISALIIGGPSFYFLNQNYNIFIDLAYVHSPELIQHLQREQSWVNGFFLASLVSLFVFQTYLGIRLTFRMVGPLLALEKHIKNVTKGTLNIHPLYIRLDDEFHQLVDTYNYLYKTLRAQNAQDIKKLKKIKSGLKEKEAIDLINQIIAEKTTQITEQTNAASASAAPETDSARAS